MGVTIADYFKWRKYERRGREIDKEAERTYKKEDNPNAEAAIPDEEPEPHEEQDYWSMSVFDRSIYKLIRIYSDMGEKITLKAEEREKRFPFCLFKGLNWTYAEVEHFVVMKIVREVLSIERRIEHAEFDKKASPRGEAQTVEKGNCEIIIS